MSNKIPKTGDWMLKGLKKFINKFFKSLFRKKSNVKLGLYGPPNGGKCVTPDTEIVLFDGNIMSIKDIFSEVCKEKGHINSEDSEEIFIECSDMDIIVPSFDKEKLKILPKKVSFVYAQKYKGVIYEVSTTSGRKIKVTPIHPLIRISDGGVEEVKAAVLGVGDSIAITKNLCLISTLALNEVPVEIFNINGNQIQSQCKYHNPKPISVPTYINEDFVSFVAYVLSESYHTKSRIIFSNCDRDLLSHFELLTNKLFNLKPIKRINKGVPQLEINSKTLTDYLQETLGLEPCTSESKKIPHQFMGLPENLIATFLQRYYDCEGYVSKDTKSGGAEIELSSKSKSLLEQVQILLNRFGIVGKFWEKKTNNELYHRLSIRGSDSHRLFREKIGFSIESKQKRLDNLCNVSPKRNTYFLPIMNLLGSFRVRLGLSQKEFFLDNKHVARMLRDNRITEERIKKMANSLNIDLVSRVANSDVLWDKIENIKELHYNDWVYDLTVEGTHTFLTSSGLIAHNTTIANKICQDWLGEDLGVVSNIPHETREIQIKEEVKVESKGKTLTFNIVDTPGIATKIDYEDFMRAGLKEKEAKKRAKEATKGVIDSIKWLDEMDSVLVVLDSTKDPYSQVNVTILGNLAARDIPVLIVANKTDLKKSSIKRIQSAFPQYDVVGISAKYGDNVDQFYEALFDLAG